MAEEKVSIDRFEHMLDLHGPHLERWTAADAALGARLIESDARARAAHRAALGVSGHLARAVAPSPLPADRVGRLIHGLARRRQAAADPFMSLFRPRAAFAMTVVGCLMFGLGAWTGGTVTTYSDQVAFAALDIGDQPLAGYDQ